MRLIAWDLETSNLNANFGFVLCGGWKVIGEGKPQVLSLADYEGYENDPTNDKQLLKEFREILLDCDGWVTWYGTHFDIPFLNSRLLAHGLPLLPANFPHIDGWKIAKYKLKLNSNRLASVQGFLDLKDEKTPISGKQWIRAMAGHEPSLAYVIKHCKQDVLVLEQAYERLLPLISHHPHRGIVDGGDCPNCGGSRLQKRGFHLTRTRKYQRFQCKDCGAWSRAYKCEPVKVTTVGL